MWEQTNYTTSTTNQSTFDVRFSKLFLICGSLIEFTTLSLCKVIPLHGLSREDFKIVSLSTEKFSAPIFFFIEDSWILFIIWSCVLFCRYLLYYFRYFSKNCLRKVSNDIILSFYIKSIRVHFKSYCFRNFNRVDKRVEGI